MRLLITGATGLLGSELTRLAVGAGVDVTGCFHDRAGVGPCRWTPLDVADPESVAAATANVDVVINAAYLRTGAASWEVNVGGPALLARACEASGTSLIHISSDVVFAGHPPRLSGYRETDEPDPVAGYAYGLEKADAERALRAGSPTATIVRTTLLYDLAGGSSLEAMVAASAEPNSGLVHYDDEYRCPAHVGDVAAGVLQLASMPTDRRPAIVHLGGPDRLSRYETALVLAGFSGIDPVAINRAPCPDRGRPRDLTFDSTLALEVLGYRPRSLLATDPSDGPEATD